MLGPFIVLERIGTQAYKLNLPSSIKRFYPIFYVLLLELYYAREGYILPLVEELEGEGEGEGGIYEVEKLVKYYDDPKTGLRRYLIR